MNIYIGNLPFDATEDEVRTLFAEFGQIDSVAIIKDKFTGQPRGFGFVEMPNNDEAQKAIGALNGMELRTRSLTVNAARPREERPGGGGGRGGFGGGGGGRGGYGGGGRGGDRRGKPDSGRRRSGW